MKNRLIWIFSMCCLIVLISKGIDLKRNLRISDYIIEIENLNEGKSFISKIEIEKIIDRGLGRSVFGLKINEVDVQELEDLIIQEPMVSHAKVYFDAKNKLHIKIKQREPLVRVLDKSGLSYYLDYEGKKFPVSKHFAARVPIITGDIEVFDEDFLYLENFNLKHVFLLARDLSQKNFYRALAEQFFVKSDGTIIIVPKWGDEEIVFGNYGDVEEKLANLMVFYKQIQPAQGWKKYRTIDLSYKGQIVCVNS